MRPPVDTAVRRTPLGLSPIDFAPLPDGRRLYSATEEGVEIRDPAAGHHTGSVPGFVPTRQRDGELAAVVDGVLTTRKTISKS